jgi:hypothetical protein
VSLKFIKKIAAKAYSHMYPQESTWSFEDKHLCHTSQKPTIILKLEFAKAFDIIEHEAILQFMEHKGFDKRWLQ